MGVGYKTSTEANLAITINILNCVCFEPGFPFPGNYPMDMDMYGDISYGYRLHMETHVINIQGHLLQCYLYL